MYYAAKFLGCSYIELDEHPRKFELMRTAYTLQFGIMEGKEIAKKNEESKAKVSGK